MPVWLSQDADRPSTVTLLRTTAIGPSAGALRDGPGELLTGTGVSYFVSSSLSHCVSLCARRRRRCPTASACCTYAYLPKPNIYRAVIDDVISNIKSEFDEYGVSEEVLAELQHKWEAKVIASHVAEFEPGNQQAAPPHHSQQHPAVAHHPPPIPYPPHPMHQYGYPYHAPPPHPSGPQIKTEPVDHRYMLNAPPPYPIATLPGPQIPGAPPRPGGQVMTFTGPPPVARYPMQPPPPQASPVPPSASPVPPSANPAPNGRIPQVDGPSSAGVSLPIPQVDGPSSSSSSGSPTPPPASYAPRGSAHPSLPQPVQARQDDGEGDEAINSDLDDSDSEAEREDGAGTSADADIVFCTYDKVARVKNKWKCILKDGMIHVNGKDYLFAKCTG
ncbi:hypothetical protein EIP86_008784 [Pleurotus ostreatoroseus]|nr:hypothetical protein EIP86_008784 [Pleurotus ostreatoroseus]